LTGFIHLPVLAEEVSTYLRPGKPGALMIDATLGEGGHAELFLSKFPELTVVGVDIDTSILDAAKIRLQRFGSRIRYVRGWFDEFFEHQFSMTEKPDVILFDLGISMFHYRRSGRGFSLQVNEALDMRLDASGSTTAAHIVNTYPVNPLANLIFEYGEERYSRRIAGAIVRIREIDPILNTAQLSEIVWKSVPPAYRHRRIHPATRTFQALRIAVNSELRRLSKALPKALEMLKPGGRLGVISFHSLEDRIVKNFFRSESVREREKRGMGDGIDQVRILTKKPVRPGEDELRANPASRSARLRVVEKMGASEAGAGEKG